MDGERRMTQLQDLLSIMKKDTWHRESDLILLSGVSHYYICGIMYRGRCKGLIERKLRTKRNYVYKKVINQQI